jgi:hypothetical protein
MGVVYARGCVEFGAVNPSPCCACGDRFLQTLLFLTNVFYRCSSVMEVTIVCRIIRKHGTLAVRLNLSEVGLPFKIRRHCCRFLKWNPVGLKILRNHSLETVEPFFVKLHLKVAYATYNFKEKY